MIPLKLTVEKPIAYGKLKKEILIPVFRITNALEEAVNLRSKKYASFLRRYFALRFRITSEGANRETEFWKVL